MLFLGEYEHTIDAKKRLAIPAEVRDVLDAQEHGDGFVIVPGANSLLWLWPQKTFERIAESVGGAFIPSKSRAKFEQRVFSKAARLPLDAAGRVRLPERLLGEFGLGSNVVILGVGHHLELCDATEWRRRCESSDEPSMEEIWDIARDAMDAAQARPADSGGAERPPAGDDAR